MQNTLEVKDLDIELKLIQFDFNWIQFESVKNLITEMNWVEIKSYEDFRLPTYSIAI